MEKVDYLPLYMEDKPSRPSGWFVWLKRALTAFVVFALVGKLYHYSGLGDFKLESDESSPKDVLLKELNTNLAGEWSKKYTNESHLAGTNYGLVEFTANKFKEYGFKPTVDTYDVLLSYPKDHALHLLKDGKSVYEAPLKEDALKEDETSQGDDTIPTFLGYAANGNVTAQYIFVNYGTKQDFDHLKELNIDLTGKIAIARYGKIFRGLKVKFAQEAGAIGVLLYTDPGDDFGITPANGFKQYPHGPARHESSVQRGSTQFLGGLGATPGDPTTPGYASKPGADRADPHQSIGKIPALPISYREVLPILETLNGHGEQINSWKGELEGVDYYTGPNSKYELNLYNDQDFNISTIYNVYGEIKGEHQNEAIVIGNHRDAWIKGGAGDPNSGSAVLLEVARALGALQSRGYKFKRTIILQSFDGEEYGLLGSTEAGEYFSKKYQKQVVAYFNLDSAVTGKNLKLNASPILNDLLLSVAGEIDYPEGKSLLNHFENTRGKIGILGSGSDYTVFLEHLGIPSVDLGFTGGKGDAIYQYHSNYDSYHWMEKFGDKDFVYHNVMAKYLTLLIFELSERELIKFGVESYSKALLNYFENTLPNVPKEWLSRKVGPHQLRQFNSDFKNKKFVQHASDKVYGNQGCHFKAYPEFVRSFGCGMSRKHDGPKEDRPHHKGGKHHGKFDEEHSREGEEEHHKAGKHHGKPEDYFKFKNGQEHKKPRPFDEHKDEKFDGEHPGKQGEFDEARPHKDGKSDEERPGKHHKFDEDHPRKGGKHHKFDEDHTPKGKHHKSDEDHPPKDGKHHKSEEEHPGKHHKFDEDHPRKGGKHHKFDEDHPPKGNHHKSDEDHPRKDGKHGRFDEDHPPKGEHGKFDEDHPRKGKHGEFEHPPHNETARHGDFEHPPHNGTGKHGKFHHPHHNGTTVQDLLDLFKTDLEDFDKIAEVFDQKTSLLQQQHETRDLLHWWQRIALAVHIKQHNALLKYLERNFLYVDGLKERSWFKHIIYASGRYTGYAGQVFPGLSESLEDKDFEEFIKWLGILGKSVRRIKQEIK